MPDRINSQIENPGSTKLHPPSAIPTRIYETVSHLWYGAIPQESSASRRSFALSFIVDHWKPTMHCITGGFIIPLPTVYTWTPTSSVFDHQLYRFKSRNPLSHAGSRSYVSFSDWDSSYPAVCIQSRPFVQHTRVRQAPVRSPVNVSFVVTYSKE